MDRGAWWATVRGVTRVRHDLAIKQQYPLCLALYVFILHDPKLKFHHALVIIVLLIQMEEMC